MPGWKLSWPPAGPASSRCCSDIVPSVNCFVVFVEFVAACQWDHAQKWEVLARESVWCTNSGIRPCTIPAQSCRDLYSWNWH